MSSDNNRALTLQAIVVVALLLVSVVGTAISGYLIVQRFDDVESAWTGLSEQRETRLELIGLIRTEFGYGGFIHDFKNGVLRSDPKKIDSAAAALELLNEYLDQYRGLALNDGELNAIQAIQNTLDEYGGHITNVRVLQAAGRTPREVDAVVRVNDSPALTGLQSLSEATNRAYALAERSLATAISDGRDTISLGLLVIPIPLAVSVLALFFVRRLIREINAKTHAEQAATVASRVKSDFLATMSHEIRTPMTAVLGFSDQLLDRDLDTSSKQLAAKIKDATHSLLVIINDILDVSKLEAGKLSIDTLNVHLPVLINGVVDMFRERLATDNTRHLAIVANIAEDFPEGAKLDPTRLRQILINLVGNAVKFTEKGSVSIDCARVENPDGTAMLHFEVRDTGIGIQDDAKSLIFGEFTQADNSIQRRFQGTGLGLAISKRLVEAQGGRIGFESTHGEGSTFWFEMPFVAADGELYRHDEQLISAARDIRATRALQILIVEDIKLNQEVITAIVGGFGHQVDVASDGHEGVRKHQNNDYDVILMDIRMPELSGPDATRIIRRMDSDKANIPIVALTADVTKEHRSNFIEVGMNAFAAKPIIPQELADAIDEAIGEQIHEHVSETLNAAAIDTRAPEATPQESLAPFEAATVADALGLPKEAVDKLLISFADRYGNAAEQIRTELSIDRETAARTAHSLKGLAGTLRIHEVADIARLLENAIEGQKEAATAEAIEALKRSLQPVVADIRQNVPAPDKPAT